MITIVVFDINRNEKAQYKSNILPSIGSEMEINQEAYKVVSVKHILNSNDVGLSGYFVRVIVIDADQ